MKTDRAFWFIAMHVRVWNNTETGRLFQTFLPEFLRPASHWQLPIPTNSAVVLGLGPSGIEPPFTAIPIPSHPATRELGCACPDLFRFEAGTDSVCLIKMWAGRQILM